MKKIPASSTVIDMTEITLKNGITVCYTVTYFEGNYIVGFHSWGPWGGRYDNNPFYTESFHYLPNSEKIKDLSESCSDYMEELMNEGFSFYNKSSKYKL